jgi:MSHA biogenesis protein MshE
MKRSWRGQKKSGSGNEILVQQKLLSEEQLKQQALLADQKRSGRKLGRVFVENGFVTEEQISGALARQLNIPYINLKFYNINQDLVRLLPETQARRFRALVLEDRASRAGRRVRSDRPVRLRRDRAPAEEGRRAGRGQRDRGAAGDRPHLPPHRRDHRPGARAGAGPRRRLGRLRRAGGRQSGLEEAPVVKLLQSVFDDATQVRASDIHIEPQEGRLQIRFRIDGVLHLQTEADIKIATPLALRLKLMADLDISEKRLPQDGRFAVKVKNQRIDVRISTMPTQYGESVVMRLLNQVGTQLRLDAIGMPPASWSASAPSSSGRTAWCW